MLSIEQQKAYKGLPIHQLTKYKPSKITKSISTDIILGYA